MRSVTFTGVTPVGADQYDVLFAGGASVWVIYLGAGGLLAAFGFSGPTQ